MRAFRGLSAALFLVAGAVLLGSAPPEATEAPLVFTAEVDAIIHPV